MEEDFVGSPDDEVEKAEGFTGEEGGGGYFRNFCDCPLCIRTGGYEGQFTFIFAQKSHQEPEVKTSLFSFPSS